MADSWYRLFKYVAVFMVVAWVGYAIFEKFSADAKHPESFSYKAATKSFADGDYARALIDFNDSLQHNAEYLPALRGRALTWLQLENYQQALTDFNQAIDAAPDFGATYANRAILHDRMGNYELALEDYTRALALDESLADGPHWLTRFLRNQAQKPPTIRDRAAYLRQELAKPADVRVLRIPEQDAQQRSYQR